MDEKPRQSRLVKLITDAQRRLYAYLVTLLVNLDDVDDVLQETNLVLWQKSDEFDMPDAPDKAAEQFSAWAMRVAYYQALARMKRRQRDRLRFDESLIAQLAEIAAERVAQHDDRRVALLRCMDKLPDTDRTLIKRRYSDNLSPAVIADELGRTRHAINQAMYRIRAALIRCVEKSLARGGA